MRAFVLSPASTGSTSKTYSSSRVSFSSVSCISSSMTSSLSHAKHATRAAWSACTQGARSTLQRGSSALSSEGRKRERSSSADHRFRRIFHRKKPRYRSLGGDDDDDKGIFSSYGYRTSHEEQREVNARAVYAPTHAAVSYVATSTATYMKFEEDEDEDEQW